MVKKRPRVVLVATPYSLKASDSETVGGHPASDFKLAAKDANGKPDTAVDISQLTNTNGLVFTNGGTGPTVGIGLDLTYLGTQAAACCAVLSAASNTFTGNMVIKGSLSAASGVVSSLTGINGVEVTNSGGAYTAQINPTTAAAFGNGLWAQLAAANSFSGANTFSNTDHFQRGHRHRAVHHNFYYRGAEPECFATGRQRSQRVCIHRRRQYFFWHAGAYFPRHGNSKRRHGFILSAIDSFFL